MDARIQTLASNVKQGLHGQVNLTAKFALFAQKAAKRILLTTFAALFASFRFRLLIFALRPLLKVF